MTEPTPDVDLPRARERPGGYFRTLLLALAAGAILFFCLHMLVSAWMTLPMDDAYIVVRYADHLVSEGRFSWNPGGEARFGSTSIAFVPLVAAMRLAFPSDAIRAATLSSVASMLLFLLLAGRMIRVETRRRPERVPWAIALVVVSFARAGLHFSFHLTSGMDTALGLALLTAWLLYAGRQPAPAGRTHAVLSGLSGGQLVLVRPEARPARHLRGGRAPSRPRSESDRTQARSWAISTVAALVAVVAMAWVAFGNPLPLPFFAKSAGIYGLSMSVVYEGQGRKELAVLVRTFLPMIVVAAVPAAISPRGWWRRLGAFDRGLLVGTVLLTGYQSFYVLPIMGFLGRLVFPLLAVLLHFSLRGMAEISTFHGERLRRFPSWAVTALLVAGALVGVRRSAEDLAQVVGFLSGPGKAARSGLSERAHVAYDLFWPRLSRVSAIRGRMVVAATDVGYPGVELPRSEILDLAGLNEPDIAIRRQRPVDVVRRRRPDLIYMPHPDYREAIIEILRSPEFRADYVFVSTPPVSMEGSLKVAIRRDSPFYPSLAAIFLRGRTSALALPVSARRTSL